MIVLDTNVLSEFMKAQADPAVENWLRKFDYHDLYTTSINEAEILGGLALMPAGRRRSDLESAARQMFVEDLSGHILSFGHADALNYAEIMANRQGLGRRIQPLDAMIAAVARTHVAAVATRDIADFEHCGVELLDPWSPS